MFPLRAIPPEPALSATELNNSLPAAGSTMIRSSSNHDQAPLSFSRMAEPTTSPRAPPDHTQAVSARLTPPRQVSSHFGNRWVGRMPIGANQLRRPRAIASGTATLSCQGSYYFFKGTSIVILRWGLPLSTVISWGT